MLNDRRIIVIGVVIMAAVSLACNAFAGEPEALFPVPPALTPEESAPVDPDNGVELAPTVTLPAEATVPIDGPAVRILVDLNVRGGPGVQFPRVGFLLGGDVAAVIGRDPNSGWWQIRCPPEVNAPQCWVSGGSQYTRLLAESPPDSTVEP